ncbi:MAG: ShlB/FhaC/HecB family hemolysin secretion/activation protein [Burkholderiales bacterium]|nr:ShlB/FhaC/HecB family hemolysin secretion/activation protein [Burkholderiales bacterium]
MFISVSALAQTTATTPPNEAAQEALRRQEERTRTQQQQAQSKVDILTASESKEDESDLPVETPCFSIAKITVVSGKNSQFEFLEQTTKAFLKHCIGVVGLSRIAAKLDAKLIDQGFITTRVSLGKQNLSDGQLIFNLHEGKIAEIVMSKNQGNEVRADDGWGTWKNAFPIAPGKVLNIRDLEQGMEQMKRLSSQSVNTKIEPGEEADSSVVRIERQAGDVFDRLHGSVTVDNSGSQTLGRGQISAAGSLDNLLGLNDILSLSSNVNAADPNPHHRSYGVSTGYNIPWGYHSFNFSVNTNRFAQYVEGTTARFLSSGKSNTSEMQWSCVVWRNASTKFAVQSSISARSAESFLDDVELVVQRRRTSNFEIGTSYKRFIDNGSIDFNLSYRVGTTWGKAQEDYLSAANNGLTVRPSILSFSAGYNQSFSMLGKPVSLSSSMRGQFTRDTTLSIDQLSIGGRGSVRGFDGDNVLLAESGVILRNELSTAFASLFGIQSNAFVALDYGRVSGASAQYLLGRSLAGMALGVRGQWQKYFFDFSIATPLLRPKRFHSDRFNPYFTISYSM